MDHHCIKLCNAEGCFGLMHTSLYRHHPKKDKTKEKEPKTLSFRKIVLNCKYNLIVKAHSHTEASFSSRNAKLLPI